MSFKRLDPEDFTFDTDSVVSNIWSTNTSSLISFYTSSTQVNSDSGLYYIDVYDSNPDINDSNAQVQFSVAWGNIDGLGSYWYNPITPGLSPSRTVWGQFVNLLLGEDENSSFRFGGTGENLTSFFAIIINRSCYKQAILPGSLQIRGLETPSVINGYVTDNSLLTPTADYTPAGRRYDLGGGTFGNGIPFREAKLGYLYPDLGIIIINPAFMNNSIWERQSNTNNNNPLAFISALTQFTLQSQETISSNYIFCRAQNHEFNYSTNPSFETSLYSSSLNEYMQTPTTYITSVGLYNDNNELLAVAKLSKPLKKDFTLEALIRVKLDF
jgi:hypothetical protein